MVQVLQASKVTLSQLRQRFGVVEADTSQFFTEWVDVDTAVSQSDLAAIARICSNFKYLLEEPPLLEEAVKMVVLSRLLDLAEFDQPPFRIRPEAVVEVSTTDGDGTTIRGAVDVLVVSRQLWVLAIEAKITTFALNVALPQALSYMLASNQPVTFGLLTNGAEFAFVKLEKRDTPQFALSRTFSLYAPGNELTEVLKILRSLGQELIST